MLVSVSQRASPESLVLAPARPVTRSLRSRRPRPARPPPEGAPSGRGGCWSWLAAVVHQRPARPSGAPGAKALRMFCC